MIKALVIGANGFLGSSLVNVLAKNGFLVTAFDRFSREPRFSENSNVTSFQGDFLNVHDLTRAVEGQDLVFHFLSMTTPISAEGDPTLDLRTNVLGSVELMKISAKSGIKKIYFASSGGAIYGDQGKPIYSEENPTFPQSPYAIGKEAIEGYLRYFQAVHNLESISLRISNPYGPGQRVGKPQGLIPVAIQKILSHQPLVKLGDGNSVRDYIHVDDLMNMLLLLVEGTPNHSTYNLGSGTGTTVNQILSAIEEVSGDSFIVTELPAPPTFVDSVVLDISRFSDEFGAPYIRDIRQGIVDTWQGMQ